MKIKVKVANCSEIAGSKTFELGKLYRCIRTAVFHEKFKDCIAWKQRNENCKLNLLPNRVYCVYDDGSSIIGSYYHEHHGLDFTENFVFVELPMGSTIEILDEPTILP